MAKPVRIKFTTKANVVAAILQENGNADNIGFFDKESGKSGVLKRVGKGHIEWTTFTEDKWREAVVSVWGRVVV